MDSCGEIHGGQWCISARMAACSAIALHYCSIAVVHQCAHGGVFCNSSALLQYCSGATVRAWRRGPAGSGFDTGIHGS
jgi:hypothetical protein